MTKEIFIEKAKSLYGEKYSYEKVEYINRETKVEIICPEHGAFSRSPRSFLEGRDCPICRGEKTYPLTTETFVKKANEVHNNFYSYEKTNYINSSTNVVITCPIHGNFPQTPANHLQGAKCPKCSKKYMDTEYFIEKARETHGDKYDYSLVKYIDVFTDVEIICPIHGVFKQKPREHLNGCGCQECGKKQVWDSRGRITKEEFIEKARRIHGDKYDYSMVDYVNERTPVWIICHKKNRDGIEHGGFLQKPKDHLKGNGCKKCRNSHLETSVRVFLTEKGINFEQEKTFSWLKGPKGGPMYLDFYLPDYNIGIECQGIQHFIVLKGNVKKYNEVLFNDAMKKEKCFGKNIKILYFSEKCICEQYTDNKEIIFDKNKLLEEIEKC